MAETGVEEPTCNLAKEIDRLSIHYEECDVAADEQTDKTEEILQKLESFFSAPDFTGKLQCFVQEHMDDFLFVDEGEEQPLSNYDVYLKYTKMMEGLLQDFLREQGISHDDIAKFCQEEKEEGNQASFCLDYIIASTQYEAFLRLMADFRNMQEYEFDVDDVAGYSCFSWGDNGESGADDARESEESATAEK